MKIQGIIIALLLVNAISIPAHNVPVLVVEELHVSAFATPWVIVVREDSNNPVVLKHERCHVFQMNFYGNVWFFVLNAYELYTKGYMNSEFERDCYALEEG